MNRSEINTPAGHHTISAVAAGYTSGLDGSVRPRQELKIMIDKDLSSPVIDSLVLQTLAIIRTLVDK